MPVGRYRITNPTIAVFPKDGRHLVHMVPSGAVITIESEPLNREQLVNVTWEGKKVMMFAQDLRSRALPVD